MRRTFTIIAIITGAGCLGAAPAPGAYTQIPAHPTRLKGGWRGWG